MRVQNIQKHSPSFAARVSVDYNQINGIGITGMEKMPPIGADEAVRGSIGKLEQMGNDQTVICLRRNWTGVSDSIGVSVSQFAEGNKLLNSVLCKVAAVLSTEERPNTTNLIKTANAGHYTSDDIIRAANIGLKRIASKGK